MAKSSKLYSNPEVLSQLFEEIPASWGGRIPSLSADQWETTKLIITSSGYEPVRNQIFDALINRIGLTKISSVFISNPLRSFKRGIMEFGDTIQEIGTQVTTSQQFTGDGDQFEKKPAKVKATYHSVNREVYYTITVEDPRLKRAFLEENGLQTLLNEIIAMLDNSNTLDEFIISKKAFYDFYTQTDFPIKDTQVIKIPNIRQDGVSADVLKKAVEQIKKKMKKMRFASADYNCIGQMTQSNPADMVILLDSDITVSNEINNLSAAFHPNYMDINVPIIDIDFMNDADANPKKIVGVIIDRNSFEVWDTLHTLTNSVNARGLYTNYFLHVHQLYKISAFKNIIYIVEE